jgi:glycosyltransferase involved in cell wall biosynthesis
VWQYNRRGQHLYTTIIAARAGEPLIMEALASIARQTHEAEKILVVCDQHVAIPPGWVEDMRRLVQTICVVQSPSTGMVAAINHGISISTTPFLSFLDADDLWLPQKQERQIALLEQEPSLEAVSCRAANFRSAPCGLLTYALSQRTVMFTATTFRREAFYRHGAIPPDCNHFTWLYRWWSDARERGIRQAFLEYVGLHRRLHEGNSWSVHRDDAHRELFKELRRREAHMQSTSTEGLTT